MLRGTRILEGTEAKQFIELVNKFRQIMSDAGYEEVIIPSIWDQETFVKKAGEEILSQMYIFDDKKRRKICLIPEVTAIIQQTYKDHWSKAKPKPVKVFYLSRCYRYERPQLGRYREFWQFGVELLGGNSEQDGKEVESLLIKLLDSTKVSYDFKSSVKRGLNYYIEDGFEAECPTLGTQRQVAGGGRYDCGIGFAIGIDRLLLALSGCSKNNTDSE